MNLSEPSVTIPFSYQREWQDGFGARGWKLDTTIGDPAVIAATASTGERIPTSVFVHDILDHFLCGLPMSGHRNEAVAVIQLCSRTGADPQADFAQMVDEDLMQGLVNGESLREFLPDDLLKTLTDEGSGRALIDSLIQSLGRDTVRERLIERFYELGHAGAQDAEEHYWQTGLDYQCRGELGLALQHLLVEVDKVALDSNWDSAAGSVELNRGSCAIRISTPNEKLFQRRY